MTLKGRIPKPDEYQDGIKIGDWALKQRNNYKSKLIRKTLSKEQIITL
jgi:hypothetical protein